MSPTADPATDRAWGWVHHLRDGGTTGWADWSERGEPLGAVVPGAQQLELLRRLNLTGPVSAVLVDRVLEASAVGRGQPDLELEGAAEQTTFGPRPVDPAAVSAGELLRVATAVLAEDVVAAGLPPHRRRRRPRPWRTRYRLAGDPEIVGPLRAEMVGRGRPPGGRDVPVVVLGADLGRMLADAWTVRCFHEGVRAWGPWLRRLAQEDRLPPRTDVARTARHWARRVGPERVHVVLDPSAQPDVLADLLGVRRGVRVPEPPAAVVPDLARRVAGVLGLHVPAHERTALLRRRLRPWLAGAPGPPLGVPVRHLDWVRAHAERIGEELRSAGYAVHGTPEALLPGDVPTVGAPSERATLDLALRMMLSGTPTTTSEEAS